MRRSVPCAMRAMFEWCFTMMSFEMTMETTVVQNGPRDRNRRKIGKEAALTMEANVARVRKTRAALATGLRELGFDVLPSEANFVFARRPGTDLGPLARALAARDILVRHFAAPGLRDALRITVGSDAEVAALLAELAR